MAKVGRGTPATACPGCRLRITFLFVHVHMHGTCASSNMYVCKRTQLSVRAHACTSVPNTFKPQHGPMFCFVYTRRIIHWIPLVEPRVHGCLNVNREIVGILMFLRACVSASMCVFVHVRNRVRVCVQMRVRSPARTRTCAHTYVYARDCTCMFVRKHTCVTVGHMSEKGGSSG